MVVSIHHWLRFYRSLYPIVKHESGVRWLQSSFYEEIPHFGIGVIRDVCAKLLGEEHHTAQIATNHGKDTSVIRSLRQSRHPQDELFPGLFYLSVK
jgi:hypothetical protein